MVQPVPDEELVGGVEPEEFRRIRQVRRNVLVQQSANFQRARTSRRQEIHNFTQRTARIDDVLDEEDVLSLQARFRIIHQSDVSARHHFVAVRGSDDEVDLERTTDAANEIA